MIVKFFKTETSLRPFATLQIDEDTLDEELSWVAEVLGCLWWETE